eukprot:Skav213818  [mRNA]  locus=scaffold1987:562853:565367:- [translate_table: standard]
MLSWGPQIASHTSKEQRLQQGHHADPQNSLEVYSRDHVWGALQFQQQVLTHVRRGWRPHIAQHRGAQQPLQEPSVHLEKFSKPTPSMAFQWFQFTSHPSSDRMDTPVVDPSSSSSSSSDSDSSSDAASIAKTESKPQVLDRNPEPIADEILVGQYRSVLHAMVLASDEADWRPEHAGHRLKPACGRPMRANETTILHRFDPEMQLWVDPDLASSLVAEGWSRETFAVAAVDLDRFEDVLPELSQQPLSVLQKAKLLPTVTEAQSADRQLWHVMAELINEKGWQLDDALHELTHIRHDMPSLLQLRPKAPKPQSTMPNLSQAYNPKGESKGKGKGKGKKGLSKGKPRVQWVTDLKVGDTWRQLCMRYQTGKCTAGSNCAFYHGCAYPVEGGKACGLPHGALAHKATPH